MSLSKGLAAPAERGQYALLAVAATPTNHGREDTPADNDDRFSDR